MKYVFIGNRIYVLQTMMKLQLDIASIMVVKDSFAEKYAKRNELNYEVLESKETTEKRLLGMQYDCLVSNGCPYVLDISKLKKSGQQYINIHPSMLPDLRGQHPINGAILYDRTHGVTCHFMVDKVDAGAIIARKEIAITEDLDIDLLYQISFWAEGQVFLEAYEKNFGIQHFNIEDHNQYIYYSRKNEDMILNKQDNIDVVLRKIKAFGTESQYARFLYAGKEYRVVEAHVITNMIAIEMCREYENNVIARIFGNKILVKYQEMVLELTLKDTEGLVEGKFFLT